RILGKSNQAVSVDTYSLIVSLRYIKEACLTAAIFCAVVIGVLYWFFGTELGAAVRATGCNERMARAQGISTSRQKVLGLMLSNGLVGMAGGLYAQYQGSADVNMGRGAIVIGLAAVIIGEVIFGKIFQNFALRMLAAVFGAIIYFIVIALVLQLGLSTNDLKLFSALIVALFLALPHLKGKYFEGRKGGRADA
ncbi:MAG: ABC transporter permease, partial [Acetivibrio ethanolgignens]